MADTSIQARKCSGCSGMFPATPEFFYLARKAKKTSNTTSGDVLSYGGYLSQMCKPCANARASQRYKDKRARRKCTVAGCSNGEHNGGLCAAHDRRKRLYGSPAAGHPRTMKRGLGWRDDKGYLRVNKKHSDGKYRSTFIHRIVMEQKLGRPLLPTENVHHINGCRDDNRPENLELWVKTQPCGQRPQDLVTWAREIIATYGAEVDRSA